MKNYVSVLLACFLLSSFVSKKNLQDDKNTISLAELIQFLESRNPESIDKKLLEKEWIYVSSDKEGQQQVDMWMFEIYYHDVQFILMSIFSQQTGIENNQLQLHFQKRQPYEDFIAQYVDFGFDKLKEEKKDDILLTRYKNDAYFLYTVVDKSQRMPYRVHLAKLP